ncbi:MAG: hypothetical protein KDE56_14025 [Anaerolineales bacterium]|nr:hypothetical protein [Anaerolineales bacterium]MCA9996870.1 hypothetical protein [Anaerolineales bacterium]
MSSFFGIQFSEGVLVSIWKHLSQKRQNQKFINLYLNALLRENSLLNKDWGDDPAYHLDITAFISMGLKKEDDSDEADFTEVLARHRRVLIVGGAGSGKSTLTRYVTFHLASAWLKTNRTDIQQLLPGLPSLLPLRIELKHCDGKSLEDLIYENITDVSPDYIKQ